MALRTDYWVCSCYHLMEHTDLAIQHSILGHDVQTLENRDGRNARNRVDQERNTHELEADA